VDEQTAPETAEDKRQNSSISRRNLLNGAAVVGGVALATALTERATVREASAQTPSDAIAAARFSITIDGVEIAAFSELLGILSEIEIEDIQSSGGTVLKKLPGKRTPPTITLKRGMTSSMELQAWHDAALTGAPTSRKNASFVAFDVTGRPVFRYHLTAAWPSKLEIGGLKAGATEVLMETVTIVCENLQRVAP